MTRAADPMLAECYAAVERLLPKPLADYQAAVEELNAALERALAELEERDAASERRSEARSLDRPPFRLEVAAPCPATGAASHRAPGHIRNTPKVVSGTGAFAAAARPSARTRRVSRGSMIPSSQSRAVE